MINLANITKNYHLEAQIVPILKNITITISSGEFVSIMGPSGSGKSTLMNIIGLLDRPSSGQYFFDHQDVATLTYEQLARLRNTAVGFVFQSFLLLPRMNLIENVGLPLLYQNLPNSEVLNRSERMLEKVGLASYAKRKPMELSGGQQQRVAIARALVTGPSLILADEPTGALDSTTGQEIFNLLKMLNEEDQTTIIVVTHDLTIAKQCQRIIRLSDGAIVQ